MNRSLMLSMAAFSFATMGLQADNNKYRFSVLGQNLKFEAVQVANTKAELTEFLKLVDTRIDGNELCVGEVIGTIDGPTYRINKISETESRHINQCLKKIKIPVNADINIKKGDRVDSYDSNKWYRVGSVRRGKFGYKELVLKEGTNYE
jgi:glutaredoxin-related protein